MLLNIRGDSYNDRSILDYDPAEKDNISMDHPNSLGFFYQCETL